MRIVSDYIDFERVMGCHGLGKISKNRELFTEFYRNNHMVIVGF